MALAGGPLRGGGTAAALRAESGGGTLLPVWRTDVRRWRWNMLWNVLGFPGLSHWKSDKS